LGSWIEFQSENRDNVHRVAAQKSLDMPVSIRPDAISRARDMLIYGRENKGNLTFNHRRGNRWHSRPNTVLLNDYGQLLVYLFSDEFQKSVEYRRSAKAKEEVKEWIEPPTSKLDIIKGIWESLLPNRQLEVGASEINVKSKGCSEIYGARDLSDGERIIFYLIGECLAAPDNAVIIIDEPELHLHKSIQADLWDAIEAERSDCIFVYLTHDLEFATSRVEAPKICLREYDGANWEWYLVPPDSSIPEDILLQILGSRRPVLFVEGETTSWDYLLYSYAYPGYNLAQVASCEHVIHATGSFSTLKNLHHLECHGIVDRDRRTEEQIEYLQSRNVSVLEVSEIENALLYEDVLDYIARSLDYSDEKRDEAVSRIKSKVFQKFISEKERLAASMAVARVESTLNHFDAGARDKSQLECAWQQLATSINLDDLYKEALAEVNQIIQERDYKGALAIYDNKGLFHEAAVRVFDYKGLIDYVKRLIKKENSGLLEILRPHLPTIEDSKTASGPKQVKEDKVEAIQ
jgi:hypothetical protein